MHMLTFIFAIVLLLIALGSAVLRKTYNLVPANELKRQAASGNTLARTLFQAIGYGQSLGVFLWLVLVSSLAGGCLALVLSTPAWLAFLVIAGLVWTIFSWLPANRVGAVSIKITTTCTPAISKVLHYIDPFLTRVAAFTAKYHRPKHSGLYEINDLLDLLDLQAAQTDSRITTEEIDLMRNVLQFGNLKVRDSLRPRQKIKTVSLEDTVGPVLLDEIHASGQTSFPVKKTARSKEIVGVLHVGDVGIHSTGTVQDYATQGISYIHESDNLADALHVFYQTRRQLLVVVNSFEEYVGILTLEDVLHQLVNQPAADEVLGSHDDKTVVALRHPRKSEQTVVE